MTSSAWRFLDIGKVNGSHRGLKLAVPLGQLHEAGYIEDRWEENPWAGEKSSPDQLNNPKYPRRRLSPYRQRQRSIHPTRLNM